MGDRSSCILKKMTNGKNNRRQRLTAGYRSLFSRIGFKLIVLILCVLILSMGSLAYLATELMVEFGEYSVGINEKHIRKKTTLFLSRIMDEQTRRYENSFSKISLSSAVIARQAALLLDQKPFLTADKTKDRSLRSNFQPDLLLFSGNRFFSNPASDPFTVLYWGDTRISPEIEHDISLMSAIWPLLSTVKDRTPESEAVYVVTETSFTLYYPNTHMVKKLKPIQEYEIKDAIWYQMARPENNPGREAIWTPVYQDEAGKGLMTSAVTPIYGEYGDFLGVAGIDITLDRMIEDILGNHSPGQDPGTGMFSFIVDRQGRIIAFPGEQSAVFGLPPGRRISNTETCSDKAFWILNTRRSGPLPGPLRQKSEPFTAWNLTMVRCCCHPGSFPPPDGIYALSHRNPLFCPRSGRPGKPLKRRWTT